jgi:hypothetical protein
MTETISKPTKHPHDADLENQEKVLKREEKLETGLEESMDASDPPATTAPGDHGDPVPSSGFPGKDKKKKRKQ